MALNSGSLNAISYSPFKFVRIARSLDPLRSSRSRTSLTQMAKSGNRFRKLMGSSGNGSKENSWAASRLAAVRCRFRLTLIEINHFIANATNTC